MSGFALREGTEADLGGIAELYRESGLDRTISAGAYAAWWRWLFLENPYPLRKILVGTDDGGGIIAHCALLPMKFRIDGAERMAGALCQIMVAEAFRKQPVFITMELKILEEYPAAGFDFAYGLANIPPVITAHLRLGFCAFGVLPVYARPYNPEALARALFPRAAAGGMGRLLSRAARGVMKLPCARGPRNLAVTEEACLGPEMDGFLERAMDRCRWGSARTVELLTWRFRRSPLRRYRIFVARDGGGIEGYAVTVRMPMRGFDALAVVDIIFPPDRRDVGNALLRRIHDEAVASDADLSVCMLNPRGHLLPVFRRWGYLRTPESFTALLHQPPGGRPVGGEVRTGERRITWFDHDYV